MARLRATEKGERRTAFAGCQLTPTERAALNHAASVAGVAVSDYIRAAIFSRPLPTGTGADGKAIRELAAEIARVGNNLNQMALRANTAGQIKSEAALQAELAQLATVMARVIEL